MRTKEDDLLIAIIEDRIQQTQDRYMITSTGFLDMHQKKVALDYCRSHRIPDALQAKAPSDVRYLFYGGYDEAERCILCFLPEYVQMADASMDTAQEHAIPAEVRDMLSVIRVTTPKGGRALTHRDYLGSLLSLGIDREVTGDILVRQDGADIIALQEMADFIELNYRKAAHQNLSAAIIPIDQLDPGIIDFKEQSDTVASLRLDNIVASAFHLSRAKAAEAIRAGLVSVNSMEALKTDMLIEEKDKIVLRGKGKVILSEIGGTTRKDRTFVTYTVYK